MAIIIISLLVVSFVCSGVLVAASILGARADRVADKFPEMDAEEHRARITNTGRAKSEFPEKTLHRTAVQGDPAVENSEASVAEEKTVATTLL